MNNFVIGVFGKINSGKSTLVNSLAREEISIVSNFRGSTSDTIFKMTEIAGIGKVQLADTAGYDDESVLAEERMKSVEKAFLASDLAIIVCGEIADSIDNLWIEKCKQSNKKYVICYNIESLDSPSISDNEWKIDAKNNEHIDLVLSSLKSICGGQSNDILGGLVKSGDMVLLCMPQDDGAPTGRLILPQSITIRSITDKDGCPIIANKDNFEQIYNKLKEELSLVITDSSVFDFVYEIVGDNLPITSFSVLFAKLNGDIDAFVDGVECLNKLQNGDKILIMEACSHTLSHKDIGSVMIPNLIKKYTDKQLKFDFLRGKDEPSDWTQYKLVVHCGGCTQNREFIMARVNKCKRYGVPITNYGVIIAKIKGILEKIVY